MKLGLEVLLEKQVALLGDIRRVLSKQPTGGKGKAEPIAVSLPKDKSGARAETVARHGSARHARHYRRTRAS